mmetsp:Transcript_19771/g.27831  ORF Transcript_19771/g.27831 Transcript_19771/m.27831 type:complete len:81 (+) Transcript_19771:162-404(+)
MHRGTQKHDGSRIQHACICNIALFGSISPSTTTTATSTTIATTFTSTSIAEAFDPTFNINTPILPCLLGQLIVFAPLLSS